ncbi:4-hydroxybenzoate polyprenyltransferase [Wenyingzhuangia heitensis]|uniref:4-hydroxybenzoate polyprenyltransferase n=1 Tax=Wenyingzhuangia heitensis TaxID=1487859 RepID=A0ABX0U6W0_9FLAO|nr:4-hydroxybenzoate polyprenyltransferase [Wenyingzhuangia heitensis]
MAAAGNIINDYFDITTDQINKPNKQIVSKIISAKNSFLLYIVFNTLGLLFGTFACYYLQNIALFCYGIFSILLLYIYSKKAKGIPFLGNFLIASLTGFSILFFLLIIPSNKYQTQTIYALSYFAFILNLIREVVKDIEDVKGDKKAKLNTLPIAIGTKYTVLLCKFLMGITFSSLLIVLYLSNSIYLKIFISFFLIIPLAYCYQQLKFPYKKNQISKISRILKLIIACGILAVFFT